MKFVILLMLIVLTGCDSSTEVYSVSEGNEEFYLENDGSVAVLLVHGFAASPWQVREMGDYLFDNGIAVYGVRIEGHGTSSGELKETTWEDWYKSVEDAYDFLNEEYEDVYVVGLSLGGLLTVHLAEGADIDGIVLISLPVTFKDKRAESSGFLKYFAEFYEQKSIVGELEEHYYRKRPVASLAELVEIRDVVKKELWRINDPVLIIHSEADGTAAVWGARFVYDLVNSDDKELVVLSEGDHVLVMSDSKEKVFDSVYGFIMKNKEKS